MFSHAICIDFEATCYDKLEKPPIGWQPEIIEFPAVLIDLQNGNILSEFHKFVRPTETPEISKFCRKFLHLDDRQFEDEEILEEVIKDFRIWESSLEVYHHKL